MELPMADLTARRMPMINRMARTVSIVDRFVVSLAEIKPPVVKILTLQAMPKMMISSALTSFRLMRSLSLRINWTRPTMTMAKARWTAICKNPVRGRVAVVYSWKRAMRHATIVSSTVVFIRNFRVPVSVFMGETDLTI